MPNVSFFTDKSSLPVQTNQNAYGPVVDNESTKYRVTSLFAGSANASVVNPKAYAVMSGNVIIVPSEISGKVNLLLRPNDQSTLSGISKVKYFVYRGLLKSDFFKDDGTIVNQDVSNNEIIKDLYTANKTLNNSSSTDNFKKVYDLIASLADDENLENIWTRKDCYFSTVNQGDFIGLFDGSSSSNYGFEIWLQENGFNPNIKLSKLNENTIDISFLQDGLKEIKKLEILNYIDPSAYFGAYILNGYSVNKDSKSAIFTNFLSKFYTKNRVYLDIRNKYGLPIDINILDDILTEFRFSTNGEAPSSNVSYRNYKVGNTVINDWPICIIKDGFVNRQIAESGYDYYVITIALRKGTVTNTTPLIHSLTNHLEASWPKKKSYSLNDNYYVLSMNDVDNNWTENFKLAVFSSNTSGNPVASSYIKLQYCQYNNIDYINNQVLNSELSNLDAINISNQFSPSILKLPSLLDSNQKDISSLMLSHGDSFYFIGRNTSFEMKRGKCIDKAGEVCFCHRASNFISPSNFSDVEKKAMKLNKSEFHILPNYNYWTSNAVSFYDFISIKSVKEDKAIKELVYPEEYLNKVLTHNFYKKNKAALRIHKVEVKDGNNTVKCLEVRVNDPLIIKGLDSTSPVEPIISLAYSYEQKNVIQELVNSNFLIDAYVFCNTNQLNIIEKPNERRAFSLTIKLLGIRYINNRLVLENVEVPSVNFYSIDGLNFQTNEYVSSYQSLISSPTITNELSPNFTGSNIPFNNITEYKINTLDSIRTILTNMRGTITNNVGVNDAVLYGEVRDYMYDQDLDGLTFEIAFRCPFFQLNPLKVPYTNAFFDETLNSNNSETRADKRINNPFIDNFDNWFQYANTLRLNQETSHPRGALSSLRKNGLSLDYNSSSLDAFKLLGFPDNFLITKPIFDTEKVKGYQALVMKEENDFDNYTIKPHFPGNILGTEVEITPTELSNLVTLPNNGGSIISEITKTQLLTITNAEFGYTRDIKVSGGPNYGDLTFLSGTFNMNLTNTYFLYTKAGSDNFFIRVGSGIKKNKDGSVNNSGVTTGLGFDMGQKDFSDFEAYTPYNVNTSPLPANSWRSLLAVNIKEVKGGNAPVDIQKKEIVKLAHSEDFQGLRGGPDIYMVFKEIIWNYLDFPFNSAVSYAKKLMQNSYERDIVNKIARDCTEPILKVYPDYSNRSAPFYYETGGAQFLNEIEKFILLTMVYNNSIGNVFVNIGTDKTSKANFRKTARIIAHAVNTHDIRWLTLGLSRSGVTRKSGVLKELTYDKFIKHYRNTNQ